MTALPAGWSTRHPSLDDVPAILAVVHASDIAAIGYPDFTTEEIQEILTAPGMDPQRDSWLAVDAAGEVVAWSYLDNVVEGGRDFVEVYAHPEHGRPAQPVLLATALERVGQRAAEWGIESVAVRAGAVPSEEHWIGVLEAAGFDFVKRYARMTRSLDGAPTVKPELPEGVTIRRLRHEDEADMREFHRILDTAFRDTPDYQPTSYEQWREKLAALPRIVWDEWLVAEVDGAPAGILQSSEQAVESNEGWVKNLAVLPAHRKRGLGGVLLAEAFSSYAGKGRTAVGLGVDLANPTQPYRLYTSVGMHPAYEANIYERSVSGSE